MSQKRGLSVAQRGFSDSNILRAHLVAFFTFHRPDRLKTNLDIGKLVIWCERRGLQKLNKRLLAKYDDQLDSSKSLGKPDDVILRYCKGLTPDVYRKLCKQVGHLDRKFDSELKKRVTTYFETYDKERICNALYVWIDIMQSDRASGVLKRLYGHSLSPASELPQLTQSTKQNRRGRNGQYQKKKTLSRKRQDKDESTYSNTDSPNLEQRGDSYFETDTVLDSSPIKSPRKAPRKQLKPFLSSTKSTENDSQKKDKDRAAVWSANFELIEADQTFHKNKRKSSYLRDILKSVPPVGFSSEEIDGQKKLGLIFSYDQDTFDRKEASQTKTDTKFDFSTIRDEPEHMNGAGSTRPAAHSNAASVDSHFLSKSRKPAASSSKTNRNTNTLLKRLGSLKIGGSGSVKENSSGTNTGKSSRRKGKQTLRKGGQKNVKKAVKKMKNVFRRQKSGFDIGIVRMDHDKDLDKPQPVPMSDEEIVSIRMPPRPPIYSVVPENQKTFKQRAKFLKQQSDHSLGMSLFDSDIEVEAGEVNDGLPMKSLAKRKKKKRVKRHFTKPCDKFKLCEDKTHKNYSKCKTCGFKRNLHSGESIENDSDSDFNDFQACNKFKGDKLTNICEDCGLPRLEHEWFAFDLPPALVAAAKRKGVL